MTKVNNYHIVQIKFLLRMSKSVGHIFCISFFDASLINSILRDNIYFNNTCKFIYLLISFSAKNNDILCWIHTSKFHDHTCNFFFCIHVLLVFISKSFNHINQSSVFFNPTLSSTLKSSTKMKLDVTTLKWNRCGKNCYVQEKHPFCIL